MAQKRSVKDDIPLANYARGVWSSEDVWMKYLTTQVEAAKNQLLNALNTYDNHTEEAKRYLQMYLDKPATAEQRKEAEKPFEYHFPIGKDGIDHYSEEIKKIDALRKLLRNF